MSVPFLQSAFALPIFDAEPGDTMALTVPTHEGHWLENPFPIARLMHRFDATIMPQVYCTGEEGTDWSFAIAGDHLGAEERFATGPVGSEETDHERYPDVDDFVRRLIHELTALNPERASALKVGKVAADFGAFAVFMQGTTSPDFQDADPKASFANHFFGSTLQ
jgi:hypothetical protein